MLKDEQKEKFIKGGFNWLTGTNGFRTLSKWAFQQCDKGKTGQIGKSELYVGILLVHVHLAKYAGPAACYPPSREIIDELFDASDDNNDNSIDEEEFLQIMAVCCAQISSRILVYYSIIILLVPYIADIIIHTLLQIDDVMGWGSKVPGKHYVIFAWFEKVLTWGEVAEQIIRLSVFFLFVPLLFNYIDKSSKEAAQITQTPSSLL